MSTTKSYQESFYDCKKRLERAESHMPWQYKPLPEERAARRWPQNNPHLVIDPKDHRILGIFRGSPMKTYQPARELAESAARKTGREMVVVAHPYVPKGFKKGVQVSPLFYHYGAVRVAPGGAIARNKRRKSRSRYRRTNRRRSSLVGLRRRRNPKAELIRRVGSRRRDTFYFLKYPGGGMSQTFAKKSAAKRFAKRGGYSTNRRRNPRLYFKGSPIEGVSVPSFSAHGSMKTYSSWKGRSRRKVPAQHVFAADISSNPELMILDNPRRRRSRMRLRTLSGRFKPSSRKSHSVMKRLLAKYHSLGMGRKRRGRSMNRLRSGLKVRTHWYASGMGGTGGFMGEVKKDSRHVYDGPWKKTRAAARKAALAEAKRKKLLNPRRRRKLLMSFN